MSEDHTCPIGKDIGGGFIMTPALWQEILNVLQATLWIEGPPEDWNLEAMEEPMPLEAILLGPEGQWNEEAFLALQARDKPTAS